jgi:2-methylisocitrate lyase-like PEP mutase family enzyme
MPSQAEKAARLRALHVAGRPLVLFNIWDVGSARAVEVAGARALATGSWSVAKANGFADGEHVPLELAIANAARIVAATELPVSVDLETGYGADAEAVGRTVDRAIAAGAVGCNLEDSIPATSGLRAVDEQAARIRAARRAGSGIGSAHFINARTDVFFQGPAAEHDVSMLEAALARGRAYADAGADGLFVPGLVDLKLIERLTARSPLPVNIMMGSATPSLRLLAGAGVARVSHGPGPFVAMTKMLEAAARTAMAAD